MDLQALFESIRLYFAANPNMFGLALAALGALLLAGTVLQWEWVLAVNHRFSLLRALLGPRGQMFAYSALFILVGLALFLFL